MCFWLSCYTQAESINSSYCVWESSRRRGGGLPGCGLNHPLAIIADLFFFSRVPHLLGEIDGSKLASKAHCFMKGKYFTVPKCVHPSCYNAATCILHLQVNNVDFANIIREEAVLFLLDLPKGEEVSILAQKKKDGQYRLNEALFPPC